MLISATPLWRTLSWTKDLLGRWTAHEYIGVKSSMLHTSSVCVHSHRESAMQEIPLLNPSGLFFAACFPQPALLYLNCWPFFPHVLKHKITQAFTSFSYVSSALVAGMPTMRCLRSVSQQWFYSFRHWDCTVTQSRLFPNIELPMKSLFKCLFITPSHIPGYSPLLPLTAYGLQCFQVSFSSKYRNQCLFFRMNSAKKG